MPGSSRESRQDPRQEAKIPAAKVSLGSNRESRRKANSRRPKSWHDLAGNLAAFRTGREILVEIHCGNFGRSLDILQRISFGAILFQIKVKARLPVFMCLRGDKIQTNQCKLRYSCVAVRFNTTKIGFKDVSNTEKRCQ